MLLGQENVYRLWMECRRYELCTAADDPCFSGYSGRCADCLLKKLISEKKWYGPVAYVCSLTGLVICILSLASGTYNPFIYFRF